MINFANFTSFQKSEVSKLEWKSYNEALDAVRSYNTERKQILTNIEQIFTLYDIK